MKKITWISIPIILCLISSSSICFANYNEDLLDAVIGNDNGKVSDLILKGANINTRQPDGWTPLLFAVFNKNFELAKLLIEKGADVNAQDYHAGISVLMRAVDSGDINFINYLIKKGVNVNARQKAGNSALSYAISGQRSEIVKLLQTAGAQ